MNRPGPQFDSAALEERIASIDELDSARAIEEMSDLAAALAAGLDSGRSPA